MIAAYNGKKWRIVTTGIYWNIMVSDWNHIHVYMGDCTSMQRNYFNPFF